MSAAKKYDVESSPPGYPSEKVNPAYVDTVALEEEQIPERQLTW